MVVRHRLIVVALAALGSLAAGGCRRKPIDDKPAPPPDHAVKGELPVGKLKAFALPLPVYTRVVSGFGDTVVVVSQYSPEELASFVRLRVTGGKTTTNADATLFTDVTVPAEPTRHLTIDVHKAAAVLGGRAAMEVHDTTGLPDDPKLTNDERMRRAGLTPDGHLLDPQHLQ